MKANADLLGKCVNGLDSENDLDSDIDFIDRWVVALFFGNILL